MELMTDYVFGYGSLINPDSRKLTGPTGEPIPVRVRGLERSWNVVVTKDKMTALGVIRRRGALTNGVLVPLPESQLAVFDQREEGYVRTRLDHADCSTLSGQPAPKGNIWAYV